MPHADLKRVRAFAAGAELDALIAFSPDNYYYLSGHQPGFARTGIGAVVLPTDEALPPALTCTSFDETWARAHTYIEDVRPIQLWIEIDRLEDLEKGVTARRPKPTQFDEGQIFKILSAILRERRLDRARLGCELHALSGSFVESLRRALPEATLVEAGPLFAEIRVIKTQEEIAALREAVRLAEVGVRAMALDQNPRGRTVSQLRLDYQIAVMEAARRDTGSRGYQSCRAFTTAGGDISPHQSRNEHVIQDGDVLFVDFGATVDGYASDMGRTFLIGEPGPIAARLREAILAGFRTGFSLLGPGTPMQDVFAATEEAIRANGLPTITRGHYGHALGAGAGEQPPFLAPNERRPFEPGMVVAFETPYYVDGLGGFQCEDNVVVTADGIENLSSLPWDMPVV